MRPARPGIAGARPVRASSTALAVDRSPPAFSVVMVGAIVVSAPVLWWAWVALTRDVDAAMTALWGGLGIGFGVLILGVTVGSLLFERRGGRLMEFAEST